MTQLIVLAHNIRSTHNVGSIFRTAEGFGVEKIICSGYTPYPILEKDDRLPHISRKIQSQIQKTALGAEQLVNFERFDHPPIQDLKDQGYKIIALEQHPTSQNLKQFKSPNKIALLIGEEVDGIPPELLEACDTIVEIPMVGQKESFNVSVATGIALYHLLAK